MAGWFEAFADFSRGASPALDRYQMLRQLDTENQFKRKQQEMQQQQEAIRSQVLQSEAANRAKLTERQIQAMDQSILGLKQDQFTKYRLPGTELSPEDMMQANELGLGGLTNNAPNIDLSALGMPDVHNAGNLPEQFGPEFRQDNTSMYMGTPMQQRELLQQQQIAQQRRLMMGVLGGLDPYAQAQVLGDDPVTRPPAEPWRAPIRTIDNKYVDPKTVMEQGILGYVPPQRPRAGTTPTGTGTTPPKTGLTENQRNLEKQRLITQWKNSTKTYGELMRQTNNMSLGMEAARRGDLAAGSQAVLVTFQKILDPASVVRESEYARSAAGQALLSRIEGAFEKVKRGGAGVPLSELEVFANLANDFVKKASTGLAGERSRIERNAISAEIDPMLIFSDDTGKEPLKGKYEMIDGVLQRVK